MNYSTYRLSFPDGTYYIGSTSNTNNRFLNHKSECKNNIHKNHKLQTAWTTFGEPALQVLNFYSTKEEAIEAEQELLNEFFGTDECLNLSSNAKSIFLTEESRIKSHSVEARKKRSALLKGRTHSKETKAKMSASHKGKVLTSEHKAKISAFRKGRTHNEESKAKMSISQKTRNPVMIEDLVFHSIGEAGRFYGVSKQAIHFALKSGNFRGMKVEKVVEIPLTTQR